MVKILFQVEEGVEEDGGHWARPKIRQADHVGALRTDHIQHLKKTQTGYYNYNKPDLYNGEKNGQTANVRQRDYNLDFG